MAKEDTSAYHHDSEKKPAFLARLVSEIHRAETIDEALERVAERIRTDLGTLGAAVEFSWEGSKSRISVGESFQKTTEQQKGEIKLEVRGQVIGCLQWWTRDQQDTTRIKRLLSPVARNLAMSLEQKQSLTEMRSALDCLAERQMSLEKTLANESSRNIAQMLLVRIVGHAINNGLFSLSALMQRKRDERTQRLHARTLETLQRMTWFLMKSVETGRFDIEDSNVSNQEAQPILERVVEMARLKLETHSNIRIELKCEGACIGWMNADLFEIIIEELLKNACDILNQQQGSKNASSPPGAIRVHSSTVQMPCTSLPHAEVSDGTYLHIVIEDNGPGIPSDTIPDFFSPHVTHKEGKGTGLGLPSVQMLVHNVLKGAISVESETKPRSFTRFHIYLPAPPQIGTTVPTPETRASKPPLEFDYQKLGKVGQLDSPEILLLQLTKPIAQAILSECANFQSNTDVVIAVVNGIPTQCTQEQADDLGQMIVSTVNQDAHLYDVRVHCLYGNRSGGTTKIDLITETEIIDDPNKPNSKQLKIIVHRIGTGEIYRSRLSQLEPSAEEQGEEAYS